MFRTIVFDGDNTLYASRGAAKKADLVVMNKISNLINKPADKCYEEFIEIVNKVRFSEIPYYRIRRYSYSLLLRKYDIIDPRTVEMLYGIFNENDIANLELFPETIETLELLQPNFNLVLFTEETREIMEKKITKFHLDKFFSKIITSTEIGLMKIGGESAYKKFLELSKLNKNEILYVGDSINSDIKPAKSIGIKTVLIDRKGDKEKIADHTISNLKEIIKIVV